GQPGRRCEDLERPSIAGGMQHGVEALGFLSIELEEAAVVLDGHDIESNLAQELAIPERRESGVEMIRRLMDAGGQRSAEKQAATDLQNARELSQRGHWIGHMLEHLGAKRGVEGCVRNRNGGDIADVVDLAVADPCKERVGRELREIVSLVSTVSEQRTVLARAGADIEHAGTCGNSLRLRGDPPVAL